MLTPERWQKVRDVLEQALELAPEKRSRFLDVACSSDPSLRSEVQSLLSADEQARTSFLETPPVIPAALSPGTCLGDYEILSQIGSGGMGVVYRARDTRLGRLVAIKVLPAHLSTDSDRLKRFEQEAQSAAALNHPNILAVHQLGSYQGAPYLVSELLEGETLREQLKHGPLSQERAMDYAQQIADGLSVAHERGIIHRDLKPENVFVTNDGRIKILDFGLAKLAEGDGASAETVATLGLQTHPGMIAGTVGYMSPEQVRGEKLDTRTDLFSFGVVLYEMVTGKRPFEGDTSGVTFEAILNRQPTPPTKLNAKVSPELERIISKALEKDREVRYQHASDIRADLKRLKRDTESGHTAAHPAIAPKRHFLRWLIPLATLVVIVTGFVLYKRPWAKSVPSLESRKLVIRQLTDHGQVANVNAAISADGRLLAYVKREPQQSLRVKQIATGSEVTVLSAQLGFFGGLAFTPNGDYVYYTHSEPDNDQVADLYSVPSLGGSPKLISPDVAGAISFSPDGKQMVYRRIAWNAQRSQLVVATSDGSDEHVIFDEKATPLLAGTTSPSWSLSLNLICAGFVEKAAGPSQNAIRVFAATGELIKMIHMPFEARAVSWLSDGSGILFIGAEKSTAYIPQIWFQPYPSGEISRITNDLGYYQFLDASADGKTLITNQRRVSSTVYVGDSPASLRPGIKWNLKPISTEQTAGHQMLSWTSSGRLAQLDMWNHFDLTSATGANRIRLLGNDPTVWEATGCGAGDQLAITRVSDKDETNIWKFNPGTSELRQITTGRFNASPSCTPDGNWVIYERLLQPDEFNEILKVPTDGGTPVKLAIGAVYLPPHAVSPDGQSFVYFRWQGEGKQRKLLFVIQKLAINSPPEGIEAAGWATHVGWTPDGTALSILQDEDDGTNSLWIKRLSGGPPERLMHFDSEPSRIVAYAWSHDGRKIAITRAVLYDTDVVQFSGFH
jgi:eukaryotic-like serine/threonine-protein kinase